MAIDIEAIRNKPLEYLLELLHETAKHEGVALATRNIENERKDDIDQINKLILKKFEAAKM